MYPAGSPFSSSCQVWCIKFDCIIIRILCTYLQKMGLVRESNPGPLAPEARIIPLDQRACQEHIANKYVLKFTLGFVMLSPVG